MWMPSSFGVKLMSYRLSGKSMISHRVVLLDGEVSVASMSRGLVPGWRGSGRSMGVGGCGLDGGVVGGQWVLRLVPGFRGCGRSVDGCGWI